MGSGIAHVCALAGLDVVLTDIDAAALGKARGRIDAQHGAPGGRGRIGEEDKQAALARIATAPDYAAFADCDLVIEAATENEAVKREIFKKLVPALKPDGAASPPTPRRSRSPGSPRPPTGRAGSSACIS